MLCECLAERKRSSQQYTEVTSTIIHLLERMEDLWFGSLGRSHEMKTPVGARAIQHLGKQPQSVEFETSRFNGSLRAIITLS